MDGLGDQLLARPGLALDEHGRVGGRDATDQLVDLLHGRGAADDQVVALLELAAQTLQVARQPPELHGARDERRHLLQVEGLG